MHEEYETFCVADSSFYDTTYSGYTAERPLSNRRASLTGWLATQGSPMMRGLRPTISVVIPARNEAHNVKVVLPGLPPVYEVLLVDGDSVDGTVEAAQRALPSIQIVRQTRTGKGNALACGFLAASGDVIVTFDVDGSADPPEIPRFVEALVAGADFAKGTRFAAGGGSSDITPLRRAGNCFLRSFGNLLFGTCFSDLCYGYNAFWRDIVPILDLPPIDMPATPGNTVWGDGFEIETLISCRVASAGLRVAEVPSYERDRIHGESNLRTIADGARVLRTLVAEKFRQASSSAPQFLPPRRDLVIPQEKVS